MDEDWQTDVIRMATHKKLCYLLTLVATFAGWAETFPTSRETRDVVLRYFLSTHSWVFQGGGACL